jgi:hypothetical protein
MSDVSWQLAKRTSIPSFFMTILTALFPILGLGIGTDHVKFNLWKNSFINIARKEIKPWISKLHCHMTYAGNNEDKNF